MLQQMAKVVHKGDKSGNGMMIRLEFPSGLEIIGLATQNFYGGDWDFGPSWNYVVLADKAFLLDTGRVGMAPKLLRMMESAGISSQRLDFIVVSHGHEDHDGALSDLVRSTQAPVRAHRVYERLIRIHPDEAPADARKDFPASCWHCYMPESFSNRNCLEYHRSRCRLEIETIGDGKGRLSETVQTCHVPGHSPDALAILVGDEAVLVGDTVLPEITPFPTREAFFHQVREILPPEYSRPDSVYGLRAYLRSLKRLKRIGERFPELLVLPAHRLFYNDHWNGIDLQTRTEEILDHHMLRCAEILNMLKKGPKTAGEIAVEHFPSSSLEGFGILMAENEVLSHCELLGVAGDVRLAEDKTYFFTGSENFESLIHSLEPD
jgi:glyoxylase-like metal-dependent hydrolase (beta-lactamase superfamily II)